MKKCPFCAEEIQEDAIKCRYCGTDLVRSAIEAAIPKRGGRLRSALVTLAVLVAAATAATALVYPDVIKPLMPDSAEASFAKEIVLKQLQAPSTARFKSIRIIDSSGAFLCARFTRRRSRRRHRDEASVSIGIIALALDVQIDGVNIRRANAPDAAAIAAIILPTIREGSTYALDREMSEADALAYWMGSDKETFVAEEEGLVVGTYYLRPNQAGGGRHVCNCGYMTSATATGRRVARFMCEHSMNHARSRGYRAMQFNLVVSTNERAVRLWQSLGFEVVGTLPLAFHHPTAGYVDALVMYQQL